QRPLREPVVTARNEPAARLVPAAEVEAEGDLGMTADDDVVELEPELEPPLGRPATALVERAVVRVDEERIVRRVELDVGRAETSELVDLLSEELGNVCEEVFEA